MSPALEKCYRLIYISAPLNSQANCNISCLVIHCVYWNLFFIMYCVPCYCTLLLKLCTGTRPCYVLRVLVLPEANPVLLCTMDEAFHFSLDPRMKHSISVLTSRWSIPFQSLPQNEAFHFSLYLRIKHSISVLTSG